jgi:uncharacterized protein (DUF58 family)
MSGVPQISPFGNRASPSWIYDDPLLFRGARDYRPGDPFSRIEWKATARTGTLQVRVSDASFASEIAILVDVSSTERPWEGVRPGWVERTIVVAASLLRDASLKGYRFGVYSNGGVRGSRWAGSLPVGVGPEHYVECMGVLGRLYDVPWTKASTVLSHLAARLSSRAQIVIVGAVFPPDLVAEIGRLRSTGSRISVVFTCPEGEPPHLPVPTYVVQEKEPWNELEAITLLGPGR